MTWSITRLGVTVTLPVVNSLGFSGDSNLNMFKQDSLKPSVTSEGLTERSIALQGSFYVSGQTNAYLNTTYLVPLAAMCSKTVVLVSPDGMLDGSWTLKNYNFRAVAEGVFHRYFFSVVLVQGDDCTEL